MVINKDMMEIEVKGKTYLLGYPTRDDGVRADDYGVNMTQEAGKLVKLTSKLFYTGLLAKQPEITEQEAMEIMDNYIEEGGDLDEVTGFLGNQYMVFLKSPDGKKKKKAKIVKF